MIHLLLISFERTSWLFFNVHPYIRTVVWLWYTAKCVASSLTCSQFFFFTQHGSSQPLPLLVRRSLSLQTGFSGSAWWVSRAEAVSAASTWAHFHCHQSQPSAYHCWLPVWSLRKQKNMFFSPLITNVGLNVNQDRQLKWLYSDTSDLNLSSLRHYLSPANLG